MGSELDWGIKIPHAINKLKFKKIFNWGLTKFLPWSPPDSRDLLGGSQVLFHLVISQALSNRHHFLLLTGKNVWGLFIPSVFKAELPGLCALVCECASDGLGVWWCTTSLPFSFSQVLGWLEALGSNSSHGELFRLSLVTCDIKGEKKWLAFIWRFLKRRGLGNNIWVLNCFCFSKAR